MKILKYWYLIAISLLVFAYFIFVVHYVISYQAPPAKIEKMKYNTSQLHIKKMYNKYDTTYNIVDSQCSFDKWVDSYLKDTLKYRLDSFVMKVSSYSIVRIYDLNYVEVRFTDDNINYVEVCDIKSDKQLHHCRIINAMKNIKEYDTIVLNAKYDGIGKLTRTYQTLNSPTVYIKISNITKL